MNFSVNAACYTLTTGVDPAGSGSVTASTQNCAGGYTAGTVVQVTAVPNTGFAFLNWSGAASGTSNPVSVTMDGNKSVTANLRGVTLLAPEGEQTAWDNTFSWTGATGSELPISWKCMTRTRACASSGSGSRLARRDVTAT